MKERWDQIMKTKEKKKKNKKKKKKKTKTYQTTEAQTKKNGNHHETMPI